MKIGASKSHNLHTSLDATFGVCELILTWGAGMERLTKKEVRALLEFIKECYSICDLETFAQRVVSRLAKIVPSEFIPHRRNACATYPQDAFDDAGLSPSLAVPDICQISA